MAREIAEARESVSFPGKRTERRRRVENRPGDVNKFRFLPGLAFSDSVW